MDSVQTLLLALVQGLTEFLPISSSGHLILVPALLGWDDQGLAFDIAVHAGTLVAVVAYFRHDVLGMIAGLTRPSEPHGRLAWALVVGSVPLGLAGIVFAGHAEGAFRTPAVIAATTAGFGVLLWAVDRYCRGGRSEWQLSWRDIAVIGCAQALAIVPGTSRSGITMSAALALGLGRQAAGRFSFLLSIPAIGMAATWQLWQFAADPEPVMWGTLAVATVAAALTAFAAIAAFLRLIETLGMGVFALYRLLLAAVIAYALL